MKISAKINRLLDKPDQQVKAFASVTVGEMFSAHGLRVVEGENGLFVAMPSESFTDRDGKNQYRDIFHAVTRSGYETIQKVVLNAYHAALDQRQSSSMEVSEDTEPEPDPVMSCA